MRRHLQSRFLRLGSAIGSALVIVAALAAASGISQEKKGNPSRPDAEHSSASSDPCTSPYLPDCSGVKMVDKCRDSTTQIYKFKFEGQCRICANVTVSQREVQWAMIEASGSWESSTRSWREAIKVLGKGDILATGHATGNPYSSTTMAGVSVTSLINNSGYLLPLSPNMYPLLRYRGFGSPPPKTIVKTDEGFQEMPEYPECAAQEAPLPPHMEKQKSGAVKGVASGGGQPPTIVQAGDAGGFSKARGLVTVQIAPAADSSVLQYELKFERYDPRRRQWVDLSSQLAGYTQVTSSQFPLQIAPTTFRVPGQWRVSVRSISPTSDWSRPRVFDVDGRN